MEDFTQSDPFQYIVTEYIFGKDLITLYNIHIITKDRLMQIITGRLQDKLKSLFKSDYNNLIEFMIKYDIKISGSFILETILNESYDGDIDFYINTQLFPLNDANLNDPKAIVSPADEEFSKFGETRSRHMRYTDLTDKETASLGILFINDVYLSNKKISLIFIDSDLTEHIKKYDFNIVRNIFSYNYQAKRFILDIENLKDIYNGQMRVNLEANRLIGDRIDKYSKRGFKINNTDNVEIGKVLSLILSNYEVAIRSKEGRKIVLRSISKFDQSFIEGGEIADGIIVKCNEKECYLKTLFVKETSHIHIVNHRVLKDHCNYSRNEIHSSRNINLMKRPIVEISMAISDVIIGDVN